MSDSPPFHSKPFHLIHAVEGVRRARYLEANRADPPLFPEVASTIIWLPEPFEYGLRSLALSIALVGHHAVGAAGGARNERCRDPRRWGREAMRKS